MHTKWSKEGQVKMSNTVYCEGEPSAKTYERVMLANEMRQGRGRKIQGIARAACCGLLSLLTCCGCCFGCFGGVRAHTGMVKYDEDDYNDLSAGDQRSVNIHEYEKAMMNCTPAACVSCWCCLGGCGKVGPVVVSGLVKVASK